jgi:hypothetical protein
MKRFKAYEIVSQLKELNRTDLLYQLEQGVLMLQTGRKVGENINKAKF